VSDSQKRIQRKRTKGWKMPEGAVYVGRPTRWGNPYRTGQGATSYRPPMSRQEAVDGYRDYILANQAGGERWRLPLAELGGCDLCCWCPLDQPCHADVLLEIANA
jgi:Domain of unknown function (DUF4326)